MCKKRVRVYNNKVRCYQRRIFIHYLIYTFLVSQMRVDCQFHIIKSSSISGWREARFVIYIHCFKNLQEFAGTAPISVSVSLFSVIFLEMKTIKSHLTEPVDNKSVFTQFYCQPPSELQRRSLKILKECSAKNLLEVRSPYQLSTTHCLKSEIIVNYARHGSSNKVPIPN